MRTGQERLLRRAALIRCRESLYHGHVLVLRRLHRRVVDKRLSGGLHDYSHFTDNVSGEFNNMIAQHVKRRFLAGDLSVFIAHGDLTVGEAPCRSDHHTIGMHRHRHIEVREARNARVAYRVPVLRKALLLIRRKPRKIRLIVRI